MTRGVGQIALNAFRPDKFLIWHRCAWPTRRSRRPLPAKSGARLRACNASAAADQNQIRHATALSLIEHETLSLMINQLDACRRRSNTHSVRSASAFARKKPRKGVE